MTLKNLAKAPFPYFGGKMYAAPHVWRALGDVAHYVEPFMGSLATLLLRPHPCNRPYFSETVNDADGLLCNAWRAIAMSPDATAESASWPVCEADQHARHLALLKWRSEHSLEHLMGDPGWHDPVMAGWWIWGMSGTIARWCVGNGPWIVGEDGRITKQARGPREPGMSRQIPFLTGDGMGTTRPRAREPGVGDFHPMTMPEIRRWFDFLSARLRHVRIVNGDWSRVCTHCKIYTLSVRKANGIAGVFLDPPYSLAERSGGLYANDSDVVGAVRDWCVANDADQKVRIVLAGFSGEGHDVLVDRGWREVEWYRGGFLRGGMANIGGKNQQNRERLWLSPSCLQDTFRLEPT